MSSGGKERSAREARERTRVYQARQSLHESQARRRRRDNLLAGIVGGLLIAGVVLVQTLYFTSGPGAPQPEPTPTSSMTSSPTPVPTDSPAPTESPTPTSIPSPSATD